jgi:D-alanyl-D-alanine carboxypeptidase (penicillin-binding protein 5/6)
MIKKMREVKLKKIFSRLFLLAIAVSLNSPSLAFTTKAKQAILIDEQSGHVLFQKDADELMAPSSMTKIMTVYMVLEYLKQGKFKLDDTLLVSDTAWRKGGSKMYVEVGRRVSVQDLLRGIIIQSGNDASIVIAEGLSGNEDVFSEEMTARAHELGAKSTTFKNSTGWPEPAHLTTARDLALIAGRLIKDFPDFYPLFKEKEFAYNNIRQMNRNPLLYKDIGVDGLKTGKTEVGGYGLVASAVRGHQRLIMVVNGLETMKDRSQESEALISWGFRNFLSLKLFKAGEAVLRAPVWLGTSAEIAMTTSKDIYFTLPKSRLRDLKVEVNYLTPVPTPIKVGQVIGTLRVQCPKIAPLEIPLIATQEVLQANFLTRIRAAIYYLVWGHNNEKA